MYVFLLYEFTGPVLSNVKIFLFIHKYLFSIFLYSVFYFAVILALLLS